MFLSTVIFTFGTSFAVLWFARALQGIGSACTSTSGSMKLHSTFSKIIATIFEKNVSLKLQSHRVDYFNWNILKCSLI